MDKCEAPLGDPQKQLGTTLMGATMYLGIFKPAVIILVRVLMFGQTLPLSIY